MYSSVFMNILPYLKSWAQYVKYSIWSNHDLDRIGIDLALLTHRSRIYMYVFLSHMYSFFVYIGTWFDTNQSFYPRIYIHIYDYVHYNLVSDHACYLRLFSPLVCVDSIPLNHIQMAYTHILPSTIMASYLYELICFGLLILLLSSIVKVI